MNIYDFSGVSSLFIKDKNCLIVDVLDENEYKKIFRENFNSEDYNSYLQHNILTDNIIISSNLADTIIINNIFSNKENILDVEDLNILVNNIHNNLNNKGSVLISENIFDNYLNYFMSKNPNYSVEDLENIMGDPGDINNLNRDQQTIVSLLTNKIDITNIINMHILVNILIQKFKYKIIESNSENNIIINEIILEKNI